MASVSSLDQDMRNLRLSRYTPQAAEQVRSWIEETLGSRLPSGDLLDALKDGVALCEMANLALPPPGIKFKRSGMPFIQMENISHFLRACEMPPLSLPAHDRFLTVDLFEAKDPAQVLQCLVAFSRQAHAANPAAFRSSLGPKKATGTLSPASTGGVPTTGPSQVSSWSRKADETVTAPAWNIHQYGYMGGASQGNQGVSFGAPRQITAQSPSVPSLAEKERVRKEKAAEDERRRQQAEADERSRQSERDAEELKARAEEDRRWDEETKRQREVERRRVEEQKRQWDEQERQWKDEEEARRKEEVEMQARLLPKKPPEKPRVSSGSVLRGQSLAEYQREQAAAATSADTTAGPAETPEQARVRELEKQLEEAKERERQYQAERAERARQDEQGSETRATSVQTSRPDTRESDSSWAPDEREHVRQQWQNSRDGTPAKASAQADAPRPLPSQPGPSPSFPARPLPEPGIAAPASDVAIAAADPETQLEADDPSRPAAQPESLETIHSTFTPQAPNTTSPPSASPFRRPLPAPEKDPPPNSQEQRRPFPSRPLAAQPLPSTPAPPSPAHSAQTGTSAARAPKSLLEREMERERERQREWEANQEAIRTAPRDPSQGSGPAQTWDVNQYGFTGGDGMNRGSSAGSGINFGGRRQILGPRPQERK